MPARSSLRSRRHPHPRPFSIDKLLVALAYGISSGIVIYALMIGGRKLAVRLRPVQSQVNLVMGALMIAFALVLATNLDLKFQNFLANDSTPDFVTATPTKALEDTGAIQDNLAKISGQGDTQAVAEAPVQDEPVAQQQIERPELRSSLCSAPLPTSRTRATGPN